jgi:hypothetical protein
LLKDLGPRINEYKQAIFNISDDKHQSHDVIVEVPSGEQYRFNIDDPKTAIFNMVISNKKNNDYF